MTPVATTIDQARRYGLALRHSLETEDGAVLPAWTVVAPLPLGRPATGRTTAVMVTATAWNAALQPGTTTTVHTATLARALGEHDLGTPCCSAAHRNDGACCYSANPSATPMHAPRRPFHQCHVATAP